MFSKREKISILTITVDRPYGAYFGGDTIQGHLTVEITEEIKIREIRLRFLGKAFVRWKERHTVGSGDRRRRVTKTYRNHQTYFDTVVPLLQGPGGEIHLTPNRYTYPFSFLLPAVLASSFEGHHGRIRYQIEACVDIPWAFDKETTLPFTVVSRKDLNAIPLARQGQQNSDHKTLCCLCCESGPITADFTLNKTGFVPGEGIHIKGRVSNSSNRDVTRTTATLMQYITYRATTKSRTRHFELAQLAKGETKQGDDVEWNEMLQIPPIPPTNDGEDCRIIDIVYVLEVKVVPSGPSMNMSLPFNIIVGTIPLADMFYNYYASPMPSQAQIQTPATNPDYGPVVDQPMPGAPGGPQMGIPPPSYSQCMAGGHDINASEEGDDGGGGDDEDDEDKGSKQLLNTQYTPVYTYYDWKNMPSQGANQQQ